MMGFSGESALAGILAVTLGVATWEVTFRRTPVLGLESPYESFVERLRKLDDVPVRPRLSYLTESVLFFTPLGLAGFMITSQVLGTSLEDAWPGIMAVLRRETLLGFPPGLVISFSLYEALAFYVIKHAEAFVGRSAVFRLLLLILSSAANIFGVGFVLYYGYTYGWLGSLKLVAVSLVIFTPIMLAETLITTQVLRLFSLFLSMVGLVGLPVLGWLMVIALR
jgi:hypothetical protein